MQLNNLIRREIMKKNIMKTIGFATLAGVYFLLAILLSEISRFFAVFFAVYGAVSDWLPYFLGWMGNKKLSFRKIKNMPFLIKAHTVLAFLAYIILIFWLTFFFTKSVGWIFFAVWFVAYFVGIVFGVIQKFKNRPN